MNSQEYARAELRIKLRAAANANVRSDMEAERARLQSLANQSIADSRQPATMEELVAAANDIDELMPTDREILDVYIEAFGGTDEQAVARLELFVVAARAELVEA